MVRGRITSPAAWAAQLELGSLKYSCKDKPLVCAAASGIFSITSGPRGQRGPACLGQAKALAGTGQVVCCSTLASFRPLQPAMLRLRRRCHISADLAGSAVAQIALFTPSAHRSNKRLAAHHLQPLHLEDDLMLSSATSQHHPHVDALPRILSVHYD